jgi:hypothetical protein
MASASKKRLREMEEIFQRRFERLQILREEKKAAEQRQQQLLQANYGRDQEADSKR